jgi:3-phosphoshikimate 1-carboxyvinyltransferase
MTYSIWKAPTLAPDNKFNSILTIPGSKSVTNRALILAALSNSPSTLIAPLIARDTQLMIKGLQAIGIKIENVEIDGQSAVKVTPAKLNGPAQIDVGNAGTVMRFLPPVAALANGLIHFDGDPRSHERPIDEVIKALENLGVTIEHNNKYHLPITINGSGKLNGGKLEIDASASSQFISSLLLIAPCTENGIEITNVGKSLPSMPHIEMTVEMLRQFGAKVEQIQAKNNSAAITWKVSSGNQDQSAQLRGQTLIIEPDLSNAAPFLVAAMICASKVTIRNWPSRTSQPGDQLRKILTQMGASIQLKNNDLILSSDGEIKGIDIDMGQIGELTPTIAALTCFAKSKSILQNIGHLRKHETDRLKAIATEFNKFAPNNGKNSTTSLVVEGDDYLEINPQPLSPPSSIFNTYEDHRMATAAAILGLKVANVQVENIETTRKTLPDFPGLWRSLIGA